MSGDERSLFEELGISKESLLPEPPEDVWSAALARALDPESAPVDDALVPQMDDDPVYTEFGGDGSALLDGDDGADSADGDGSDVDFRDFGDIDSSDDAVEDIDDIDLGDGGGF